jgi:hypothetical protein
MYSDIFSSINNVRFSDLLSVCRSFFGDPEVKGNHFIFKTPWREDPVLSIQKDGVIARPYQVKAVKEALEKLEGCFEKH